jgi:hypothetical protein
MPVNLSHAIQKFYNLKRKATAEHAAISKRLRSTSDMSTLLATEYLSAKLQSKNGIITSGRNCGHGRDHQSQNHNRRRGEQIGVLMWWGFDARTREVRGGQKRARDARTVLRPPQRIREYQAAQGDESEESTQGYINVDQHDGSLGRQLCVIHY